MSEATANNILICYGHPKTGSTSILRNARLNLEADQYYVVGPARSRKLRKKSLPSIDLYDRKQLDRVAFITGHKVGRATADMFASRNRLIFSMVRDPYERLISVIKHRRRKQKGGGALTPRAVFDIVPPNPFMKSVMNRFGGETREDAMNEFDIILATENIDRDSHVVFAHIGLPGVSEHARVYPETIDMEDLTREEVYERHADDLWIHQQVLACEGGWRRERVAA